MATMDMNPPFAEQFFDAFDALFAVVQNHARQTGWTVVKTCASNRRANGNYYKYDLGCHRGGNTHEKRSTGRRQASSRKEGCPWTGVAVARKSNQDRWTYETINPTNSHPPFLNASVHSMHRRFTSEERGSLEGYTQAGSRLKFSASDLRSKNQALKKKDILNERAKLQRQASGPYTQTQRFIQALEESEEFHRELGNCMGAFTAQYGLPCKHAIYGLLRVEIRDSGVREVVATRPLRLQDVCKYWRLPHRLKDVDLLLAEEDPRVVARRGRPRNASEEGIVPRSGTVIRRSVGQRSWQREPSSHEYLKRPVQSSG